MLAEIIKFSASWCNPCKVYSKTFEIVSSKYNGKIGFKSYDVDDDEELAERYGVRNVPFTLFIDESGTVIDTVKGLISKEELEGKIITLTEQCPIC